MPVSPQDFALWSNLTGNPYPQTPVERMALAPQVYEFNKNLGRRGGPTVSPIGRAVDVVGKAALAAGALAGAAYLGSKYLTGESFSKLDLDDEPGVGSTVAEAMPDVTSQVAQNSGDVTPPTTAGRFNQNLNINQTTEVQQAKGLSAIKPTTTPIEEKPATQSEVIGSQQHFSPGTEEEMLGQGAAERAAAFRKSKAYAVMQSQYPGLQDIESPTQPASVAPTVLTDVNVGAALKAKGLYLAGDPTDPHDLRIMTEKGGEYLVFHPYAEHSKAGIRETALQEQSRAHELLASAGVTPESAKSYFAKKFGTPTQSVVTESPVAAMATPSQAPVTASVGAPSGASSREVQELDATLARAMARHTPEQRAAVRDQMLAKKYQSSAPAAEPATVVTPVQPNPVRVATEIAAKPAKVRANEFLSRMSQEAGPLESYKISPSRSTAVSGVAFYPGGEVGVSLPTKSNPAKEYVYGASDPLRLALGDYAEEGFPSGMGHVGKILGYQGIAPGMGMLQRLTPGGQSSQSTAPLYTGLMSEKEIGAIQANPRSPKAKVQRAGYDADTRRVMEALQQRAAMRGQ